MGKDFQAEVCLRKISLVAMRETGSFLESLTTIFGRYYLLRYLSLETGNLRAKSLFADLTCSGVTGGQFGLQMAEPCPGFGSDS